MILPPLMNIAMFMSLFPISCLRFLSISSIDTVESYKVTYLKTRSLVNSAIDLSTLLSVLQEDTNLYNTSVLSNTDSIL